MKSSYFKIGLSVILPPFLIAGVLSILKTNEDWLGYWGGIIGSSLGVLGAFMILKEQINNEREQTRKQQIDNTFFNLLSMHNDQITTLNDQKVFQKINDSLKNHLDNAKSEAARIYVKDNQQLANVLSEVKAQFEGLIEKNQPEIPEKYFASYNDYWLKDRRELTFYWIDSPALDIIEAAIEMVLTIESIFETELKGQEEQRSNIFFKLRFIDEDLNKFELNKTEDFKTVYSDILRYSERDYSLIDKEKRNEIVENALSKHYREIGSYFRLFHRIIKYLNNSLQKADEQSLKNDYIGFLRAAVNQKEMLVIFYNAAYTTRGEGLLHELQKTTFFGTEEDIQRDQHFERSDLVWEKEDVDIMLNKVL